MKVEILEFVEGARRARGITVIIDVFRAFSVACYAADAGAARIQKLLKKIFQEKLLYIPQLPARRG